MAIYSDNFNRADGDEASGNWTVNTGDWNIASNRLTKTSGDGFIRYNTDLGSADHFCEADVVNQLASGCYTVLDVRRNTSNNDCYQAYASIDTGTFVIGRVISGSYSHITLGSSFTSPFTGRLRLEVQGSTLRLYVNGVLDITTTNTEITSGNYVGLNGFSGSTNENQWDNFVGGTLPAAGAAKSVRFDAGSDRYSRVATGIAAPDMTWCAWVKLYEDPDYYQSWMSVDNASAYHKIGTGGNGTTLWIDTNGGTWGDTTPFDLVPGQWAFVGSVYRSGSPGSLFHAQAADAAVGYYTHSANNLDAPNPALTFYIGASGFGDNIHGLMAQVKVWSAALTEAEINAEFKLDGVARTSGLWAYYSFRNGIQTSDESGNGRTLTAGGSIITDLDGPPVAVSNPKIETLTDSFDTEINATKWPDTSGSVTWVSGQARIPVMSSYLALRTGLVTGTAYDLTGSSIFAKYTTAAVGSGTKEYQLLLQPQGASPDDSISIKVSGTTITANKKTDGTSTQVASTTYSATNHLWWRIRESGGTIFYDTSADGASWTNWTSTTVAWPITALSVSFISGYSGTESLSYSYVDNVNVPTAPAWITFSEGISTATAATVTGLTNGTAYEFRVIAVNAVGESVPSATAGPYTPVAPVNYNETGRSVTIVSTTTSTDQVDFKDLTRSVTIVSTITTTERNGYKHLALPVAVVSTTTTTDRARFIEAGPNAAFPVPVLAYNFSEGGTTAIDRSGNGNNAVLQDNTTATDIHDAGELSLSASQRNLSYTPSVKPTIAATVVVTIRSPAGTYARGSYWSLMNANDTSGFNLCARGAVGEVYGIVRGASAASVINGAAGLVPQGGTVVLALSYDGTTTRLYKDGTEVGSATTATGNLNITGPDWRIGYNANNPNAGFVAFFADNVRFWHEALTAAQIAAAGTTPVNPTASDRSVAIVATVTSTDSVTGAPVNYNETGRLVSVVSTVTQPTDKAGRKDLALSVAIASTLTTTDAYTAHYNETGRALTLIATVGSTDALKRGETGRALAIVATVTQPVDQADFEDPDRPVAVVSTVTITEAIKRGELARSIAIVSTTTTTDLLRDRELDRSVAIVAGITVTDLLTQPGRYDETNRPVSILATMTLPVDQADLHDTGAVAITATVSNAVDQTDYKQLALPVAISSTVAITQAVKLGELTRPIAIVATTTQPVDQADFKETALSVAGVTTVALTTAMKLGELNRPVALVSATSMAVDKAGRKELPVGVAVVSTTMQPVDQADFKDLTRSVAITATVTSLDVMSGAPIHYTETNLKVIVASTLTGIDRASFRDSSSVAIVSATTLTFALRGYETQRSVAITSTLATTDQADFKDIASPVAITATVTNTGTVKRSDLDKVIAITSTTMLTDHAEFNDMLAISAATLLTMSDKASIVQLRNLAIVATVSVFDLQYYAGGVVLNRALAIYLGDVPVERVYVGTTKVWEKEPVDA